jgi:hypothetical protein
MATRPTSQRCWRNRQSKVIAKMFLEISHQINSFSAQPLIIISLYRQSFNSFGHIKVFIIKWSGKAVKFALISFYHEGYS